MHVPINAEFQVKFLISRDKINTFLTELNYILPRYANFSPSFRNISSQVHGYNT